MRFYWRRKKLDPFRVGPVQIDLDNSVPIVANEPVWQGDRQRANRQSPPGSTLSFSVYPGTEGLFRFATLANFNACSGTKSV